MSSHEDKCCWPQLPTPATRRRIAIVVVSYNTRVHLAHLVFSLYRVLGLDQFRDLVVVDNGSTDGSLEFLRAMREAGMLHLIENASQRYHGPATSQGVNWLAAREHEAAGTGGKVDYIWVLDSDVILLRRDTAEVARAMFASTGAGAVGWPLFDRWQHRVLLQMCSFLFDPAVLWRPGIPPFEEHGDPCMNMQLAAEERGIPLAGLAYVEDEYLLHLGCQTLAQVAAAGEQDNRYFDWAVENNLPHFEGQAAGPALFGAFVELFAGETRGAPTAEGVIAACLRPGLLEVTR